MAAAVHAARASPPRFQTLHPPLAPPPSLALTHPLPLPPMDRRQFTPLSFSGAQLHPPPFSFQHLPPPNPPTMSRQEEEEEEFEEDVDEDDMSDLEEELQQELLAYRNRQRQPDMTRQLLQFADMVNTDIQKFFGRKKGDEDSCDVYEDKWTAIKSGRELYYADLLKMAQGDFGDSKSSKSKSRHKDADIPEDNRNSFSGKADTSKGLGGLKDLFEQGLKANKNKNSSTHHSGSGKRPRTETDSASGTVPMHQRHLPESFWKEPGVSGPPGTGNVDVPVVTSSVLQSLGSSKLPDFSDLMESWHGEQAQMQHHQLHPLHQIQLQQQQQQHRTSAVSETFTSTSSDSSSSRKRRL
ncbi:hypothetical protein V1264_011717 [Littorina saxatilis]|uniref:Uncharacterized protein n=2 Tax=Littorina saxatilis TaxID=31220 RepID=A0AAN9BVK2_9CAEN